MPPDNGSLVVRVAAAGDLHCGPANADTMRTAFAALQAQADLVLLAGDLTMVGDPAEAEVLAAACRDLHVPVYAVLGNHDWHCGRAQELAAVLADAGMVMLEGASAICHVRGVDVGIAGVKGFVGGFAPASIPDFGEPLLRELYAETGRDVAALDVALREIVHCPLRLVVLHYAPISATLAGEPEEIWPMLGSERLGATIAEHRPDLVVHGHAHAGTFAGEIGEVPVHNVSIPVMGRDFWVFELPVRGTAGVH